MERVHQQHQQEQEEKIQFIQAKQEKRNAILMKEIHKNKVNYFPK